MPTFKVSRQNARYSNVKYSAINPLGVKKIIEDLGVGIFCGKYIQYFLQKYLWQSTISTRKYIPEAWKGSNVTQEIIQNTKCWFFFICYTLFLIKQYENVYVKTYLLLQSNLYKWTTLVVVLDS